jgi:transposase
MLFSRSTHACAQRRKPLPKAKLASWEVSEEFWRRVEPLVPERPGRLRKKKFRRKPGGGRKPKGARTVFEAIVYVLRTGCQWKALPKERFGSASAIHKRFLEWESAGFFRILWQAGLAEYDDMEGIAWRWQSVDGALVKDPLAQESVGPNPTDRGKKWEQADAVGRRAWRPAVDHRDRGQSS